MDLREDFEAARQALLDATRCQSMHRISNPFYLALKDMGSGIIPFLVEKLWTPKAAAWWDFILLHELTGYDITSSPNWKEDYAGRFERVLQMWCEWADKSYPGGEN